MKKTWVVPFAARLRARNSAPVTGSVCVMDDSSLGPEELSATLHGVKSAAWWDHRIGDVAAHVMTFRKTRIRQDLARIESGDRVERSFAAARPAEAAASLLADLQTISKHSAGRLQRQAAMTEADLYDDDGLPA